MFIDTNIKVVSGNPVHMVIDWWLSKRQRVRYKLSASNINFCGKFFQTFNIIFVFALFVVFEEICHTILKFSK